MFHVLAAEGGYQQFELGGAEWFWLFFSAATAILALLTGLYLMRGVLAADEGSLDHVLPRSRGGRDAWENLVWSSKDVNAHKGNRLPHEAGLRLLRAPRAPKELPVSALIRNAHSIPEWKLFVEK